MCHRVGLTAGAVFLASVAGWVACEAPKEGGADRVRQSADWSDWWRINCFRYLELKREFEEWAPTPGEPARQAGRRTWWSPSHFARDGVLQDILPALLRALDGAPPEETTVSVAALMAMAKLGEEPADVRFLDVCQERLATGVQEVQETAALALGVVGWPGFVRATMDRAKLLCGLALDDESGRAAVGLASVGDRTRAFAAYGLGQLANKAPEVQVQQLVLATLKHLLEDAQPASQDVRVAAIHGLSLLQVDGDDEVRQSLLAEAVEALRNYYLLPLTEEQELVQAHCPTAIAKLIGREHALAARYRELFALGLAGDGEPKRAGTYIARSCALALGRLCCPNEDEGSRDARFSWLLLGQCRDAPDEGTRCYAALALGEIGGAQNRSGLLELLRVLKGQPKAWCALALGTTTLQEYRKQEKQDALRFVRDKVVGEALFAEFGHTEDPSLLGALAIALGLCRHVEAAPRLREMLHQTPRHEDLVGDLCIGLALMNDFDAIDDIRLVVARADRQPHVLEPAAIALSRLGDRKLTVDLMRRLGTRDVDSACALAVATAIGWHGDADSIKPLRDMLVDDERDASVRAAAALALGIMADKEILPWNNRYAMGTNVSAATDALTNSRLTGILDLP